MLRQRLQQIRDCCLSGICLPCAVPFFIVAVLYLLYYRPQILPQKRYEIVKSMGFIYKNYDEWYKYKYKYNLFTVRYTGSGCPISRAVGS